jgi:multidrug efflux pump subunit AcrB
MAQAMAETVGYVNRSRAFMPPGTVSPFIMRFDTGSVPVGYLVLRERDADHRRDPGPGAVQGAADVRRDPGVSAPPPFGGSQRTVVVRADPERLRAYGISPTTWCIADRTKGNTIAPSGQIRDATRMPLVPTNAMVVSPRNSATIEVKPGVFLRRGPPRPGDRPPLIEDASDIPTGYALVNGKRAVYILVTKRANASTLDVVNNVKRTCRRCRPCCPTTSR